MSIEQQVSQLIRPEIRALQAYHVGNASGMIKLDAMENPFRWPDTMVAEWQQKLAAAELNRYPHPLAPAVTSGLRKTMQVAPEFDILLGNGSDEIIQILAMAVANPGATILAPEPGFVMYRMIATFVGLNYVGVPLNADFSLDMPAMLAAIKEHKPELMFLAQPNNPTGNLWAENDLRGIINISTGLVVMDEAYLPFSSRNHLSWLNDYDNLLVMRTLSKVGLAGLRLGLLIGRSQWLDELNKIRMPYNINILTQVSAAFALDHYDVLVEQCDILKQQRSWLRAELSELGFTVFPSEANFILARAPQNSEKGSSVKTSQANAIFAALKEHNILIKCLHGGHPLLTDCLRFTVGSEEENQALINALKDIV